VSIMMFKIRRTRKREDVCLVLAGGGVTSQQSKQVERPGIDAGEKGGLERKEKEKNQIQLITDHKLFYSYSWGTLALARIA